MPKETPSLADERTTWPTAPGYYWATLRRPSGMPEGEDWVSGKLELVEVNDNNGEGDETFSVQVFGVPVTQWPANFEWHGPLTRPTPADDALHPATSDLVDRFAVALKEKLAASERKYGWTDEWAKDDWQERCQRSLAEHLAKGDPRDVAAFAAFMWHHGWPTVSADPHAPPAGYVQAVPTITHGDQLPDGVPVRAIDKADYPATIFAMNIIRMDSGGPSWPAEDAPQVPLCWHPFLPVIEAGLHTLDNGDRSKIDLDNEMFTFCSGEADAQQAIRERSQALAMAALFLNDFFEGWSYFASEASPRGEAVEQLAYFVENPSAWENFDQKASDAIAAALPALNAGEREKRAFNHGYLIAVSTMLHQHDEPVMAEDALRDSGLRWDTVKKLGLDEFDLKVLRPVFREIERKDTLPNQPAATEGKDG